MKYLLLAFIFLIFNKFSYQLNNGLARTPPMGWLSWQTFKCNTDCENDPDNCLSETLIKQIAETMVNEGYLKMGYEYVIIDDCWMAPQRDSNNRLQSDPIRFPNGIKYLADFIHNLGLKLGIYADYGTHTCSGYPGSINFLKLDAQTFADYEVDYVKIDGCYSDPNTFDLGYPWFGYYLNKTDRPMVYSCSWSAYQKNPNISLISKYCNLWRNFGDINNQISTVAGIAYLYGKNIATYASAHGPGSWNDPDQLVIGNPGITIDNAKTQMAIWSILAAPMIMSADLRFIANDFKEILLNKNSIAINQDGLFKMGTLLLTYIQSVDIWSKPLMSDLTAFVLVNNLPNGNATLVRISLFDLKLIKFDVYNFYELFTGTLIGQFHKTDSFVTSIKTNYDSFAFWTEPASNILKKISTIK